MRCYVRWFLAGYAAAPLLLSAIDHGTKGTPMEGCSLAMLPIAWLAAPLGLGPLAVGEYPWGPWDGRFAVMVMAWLVVLVATGLWLENRNPVPTGDDGTLRVPTARVVTARRAYLLATVMPSQLIRRLITWKQLISRILGRILLVIAGASLFFLGISGWIVAGAC